MAKLTCEQDVRGCNPRATRVRERDVKKGNREINPTK